jgi:hypothetical protein
MCVNIRYEIQPAIFLLRLFDPEDESATIFRNVTEIFPNDTAKRHARLNFSPLKFKIMSTDNKDPQNVIRSSRFFISSMSKCFSQHPVFECLFMFFP